MFTVGRDSTWQLISTHNDTCRVHCPIHTSQTKCTARHSCIRLMYVWTFQEYIIQTALYFSNRGELYLGYSYIGFTQCPPTPRSQYVRFNSTGCPWKWKCTHVCHRRLDIGCGEPSSPSCRTCFRSFCQWPLLPTNTRRVCLSQFS